MCVNVNDLPMSSGKMVYNAQTLKEMNLLERGLSMNFV